MEIRKVLERRIRRKTDSLDLVADVDAAVAANVGEPGKRTSVSSRQRVVHRSQANARGQTHEGQDPEEGA